MNCHKCNSIIEKLHHKEKICSDCYRLRWRENRKKRKDNGTLKSTKMSKEYYSIKNKEWSINNSDKVRLYAKEARLRNPLKHKARSLLNTAVKLGKIIKEPCRVCGHEKSEAHHKDYDRPYDIIWLCRKHHIEIHKKESTEF
jgi:DNA-directed RNA polymerase subunit M/transcription elongation factor TFIIS